MIKFYSKHLFALLKLIVSGRDITQNVTKNTILKRNQIKNHILRNNLIRFCLILIGCYIGAQNISNPDFENFSQCPNAQSQLTRATGWTQPTTAGTPDYMNVCTPTSGSSLTLSPQTLTAQSGTGFVGGYAEVNNSPLNNYKEYLTNRLSSPLIAGITYSFSFYVAHMFGGSPSAFLPVLTYVDLPASEQGFIGAVFSTTSPSNSNTVGGGSFAPLLNSFGSGRVLIPASNTDVYGATSRNNWVKVTLQYTAVGGEEYMTVGQLRQGGATTLANAQGVYYLYDNFSPSLAPVTVLTKSVSPSTIVSNGTATYTFTLNNTAAGSVAQTNLSFTDNLPSGLRLAANPNVTVTGLTAGTVTANPGGTSIAVAGYNQAANTTATITVNVTNMPGQGNPSCGSNPTAFTNTSANISNLSGNITNSIGNVCLIVSPTPFACDSKMYLVQNANSAIYNITSSTNPFTYPIIGSPAGYQYNATGLNPIDGYIYAMRTFSNNLLRIDSSGAITDLGAISGLPAATGTTNYNSGEIDHLGNYYIKHSGSNSTIYRVNIASLTAVPITLSQATDPSDLAYNVVTNLLYGVALDGRLFSINPSTGTVSFIGTSPGAATFGALFGSSTGEIYGVNNAGGFFQFNLTNGNRVQVSSAPASGNNDGAHCVTAPITFDADLSVTKTDGTSTYSAGTNTVYTIVARNNGPFGVQNATVSDLLPAGIPAANMSYTAVASAGSTTSVTGTQTGAINDLISLPVNGTVTYTVTVNIPSTFTGNLVNTVTITAPANINDTNTANNPATDTNVSVCSLGLDSDGDGISDACDLDDDNDGILDAVESPNCFYADYEVRKTISSITSQFTTTDSFGLLYNYIVENTVAAGFNFTTAVALASNPAGSNLFTIEFNKPIALGSLILTDNISNTAAARARLFGSNDNITYLQLTSAESNINTATGTTFTIDQNQAKYKYYKIQTTVAGAIATTDYIGEIIPIVASNYIPSEYPKATCTDDLDGDGIPNHLDLDSDGDGCFDAFEGDENVTLGQLNANGSINSAVDVQGVPVLVSSGGTADIGGDQGQGNGQSKSALKNDCLDSDNDGLVDWIDLDDDNDGILDLTECPNTYIVRPVVTSSITTVNTITVGDIQTIANAEGAGGTGSGTVPHWYTNAVNNLPVEISMNMQAASIIDNIKLYDPWGFNEWIKDFKIEFYNNSNVLLGTENLTAPNQYAPGTILSFSKEYSNVTSLKFTIISDQGYNTLNPRRVSLSELVFLDLQICDTDGDGVPNRLDLDSDGDGCSDAIEGAANISTGQLVTAGGTVTGGSTTVNQNLCNAPGCVSPSGTNMGLPQFLTLPSGYSNTTGQGTGDSQNALINSCPTFCYKPGLTTGGTILDTKVGITSLARAGETDADNWPMVRKGGWIALESKTKGLVVNRVAFSDADTNPSTPDVPVGIPSGDFVEGMVVYDTTNHCLKMYTSTDNGVTYHWYCISTQTCPD
ncbi:DUF11 domain-containing protein [Epilithonimonas zeae]|uniref:DUF11 domain-containing protein n=1 Tax=Epilithonimonas zeae TaxID=1416779 RepID=UPI00200BDE96|nr:DUF11 domain-containing protein [Epilithonimonas zeae]UQB67580.1 hypothetical protein KI430_11065 [Epilithonimonas zeae]